MVLAPGAGAAELPGTSLVQADAGLEELAAQATVAGDGLTQVLDFGGKALSAVAEASGLASKASEAIGSPDLAQLFSLGSKLAGLGAETANSGVSLTQSLTQLPKLSGVSGLSGATGLSALGKIPGAAEVSSGVAPVAGVPGEALAVSSQEPGAGADAGADAEAAAVELVTKAGLLLPVAAAEDVRDIGAVFGQEKADGSVHTGLELAGVSGGGVVASQAGTVVAVNQDVERGLHVRVEHRPFGADGPVITTVYGHLSGVEVKPGQKVAQDTPLGTMGTVEGGTATPNVYFEVLLDGEPTDPAEWVA